MEENIREEIIRSYVQAYNAFDIAGMLENLDRNIRFENISDGIVNMTLNGVEEFEQQAQRAANLFTNREQTILSIEHTGNASKVDISYHGTLAEDLPNGLQRGDDISLQGMSIFRFSNNSITGITDIG